MASGWERLARTAGGLPFFDDVKSKWLVNIGSILKDRPDRTSHTVGMNAAPENIETPAESEVNITESRRGS